MKCEFQRKILEVSVCTYTYTRSQWSGKGGGDLPQTDAVKHSPFSFLAVN